MNIAGDQMPYWVGFKVIHEMREVSLKSFEDHEGAEKFYEYIKNSTLHGEVIAPPFFALSEEDAREKVKEFIPD